MEEQNYTCREILSNMQEFCHSIINSEPAPCGSVASIEYYRYHPEKFSSLEKEALDEGLAVVTATLLGKSGLLSVN